MAKMSDYYADIGIIILALFATEPGSVGFVSSVLVRLVSKLVSILVGPVCGGVIENLPSFATNVLNLNPAEEQE